MNKTDKVPANQPNEGEGNKTAARAYNKDAERFAKSGQVDQKAREAQKAVDGSEGNELAEAEAIGKSHSAGEDGPTNKHEKK